MIDCPVRARLSPARLAQYLDPEYQRPAHVAHLDRVIADAVYEGGGRIIVCEPPRHGKTELCSRATPLWFLDLWPGKRVLLSSYGADFAAEHGREVRNRIEEHADKLFVRLVADSKRANLWNTPQGGGMATAGIGGPLTGRGGDLLIIDDPVKDAEEARSETMKAKHWEWWQKTSRTRLEPGGTVIVIMTRWAEDDLVGRLLNADGADQWTVVDLPAIAEDDDPLGRPAGAPLWPERYDLEALSEIRRDVGSHAWSALYQQRPTPAGGAVFRREHFRYFRDAGSWFEMDGRRALRHECAIIQLVDTAMKTKTVNDWTVSLVAAVTPERDLLVLDVRRDRLEVPDQLPFIRSHAARWKPRWIGVEDKGSGTGLIQESARHGVPFRAISARVDKVERATPAAVLTEAGKVFFLQDAPWLADFEHELLAFPNGTHDDQVDTFAHAVNEMGAGVSYLARQATSATREPVAGRFEDMSSGERRFDGMSAGGRNWR